MIKNTNTWEGFPLEFIKMCKDTYFHNSDPMAYTHTDAIEYLWEFTQQNLSSDERKLYKKWVLQFFLNSMLFLELNSKYWIENSSKIENILKCVEEEKKIYGTASFEKLHKADELADEDLIGDLQSIDLCLCIFYYLNKNSEKYKEKLNCILEETTSNINYAKSKGIFIETGNYNYDPYFSGMNYWMEPFIWLYNELFYVGEDNDVFELEDMFEKLL